MTNLVSGQTPFLICFIISFYPLVMLFNFIVYKFDFSHMLLLSGDVQTNPGPDMHNSLMHGTNNKSLSFCHLNIRSLTKLSETGPRIDHLINFACIDNSYDVITLSETHLSSIIDDEEIQIEGYTIFRLDRNRHGGGVAIYCRTDLHPRGAIKFDVR